MTELVSSHGFRKLYTNGLALLAIHLLLAIAPLPAAAIYVPCGDANADGEVTATDALAALRSAVGLPSPCDRNCDCDVQDDREMTAGDALKILLAAVSDTELGCSFYDECFNDEDCDEGYQCGSDPDWECDAACVPE